MSIIENFTTLEDCASYKVQVLHHMQILRRNKREPDPRASTVKKILISLGSEAAMTRALRDVIRGDETIDSMIARYAEV